MIDLGTAMRDGGPLMYAVLLLAMGAWLPGAAAFVTGALRMSVPAGVWSGLAILPVAAGGLGTVHGVELAQDALARVSPEMHDRLADQGLSVALYPLLAGALASSMAFVLLGLGTALGGAVGAGSGAKWSSASLVGVPVLVASLVCAVLGAWGAVAVSAPAALILIVAGARWPPEHAVAERELVALSRVAAAAHGALAAICALVVVVSSAGVEFHGARAAMSSEKVGSSIVDSAFEGALPVLVVLILLGAAAIGFGIGALRHVKPPTSATRTALAVASALGLAGVLGGAGWSVFELADEAVPFEVRRAEVIGRDARLPRVTAARATTYPRGGVLELGAGVPTCDGQPAEPSELRGMPRLDVEAPPSLPLTALAPWVYPGRVLFVAVWTPDGLRAVPIEVGDPSAPTEARKEGDPPVVWALEGATLQSLVDRGMELSPGGVGLVWMPVEGVATEYGFAAVDVHGVRTELTRWDTVPLPGESMVDLGLEVAGAGQGAVREVLARHRNQLVYCRARESGSLLGLDGDVTATFTIDVDGRVREASATSPDLSSPSVLGCLEGRYMRMKFSVPNGGEARVVHRLRFLPR